MPKPPAQTCEVSIDGAWVPVSLDEAKLRHRDAVKRCPVCHGRVHVQGIFTAQGRPTLSHQRVHDGCPLIQRHYKGNTSRHPQAIR